MRLASIFERFSPFLALDAGSASTLFFQKGRGVFLNEPSVAAISRDPYSGHSSVLGFGYEASEMSKTANTPVEFVRPFRHGVISDGMVSSEVFRRLFKRVSTSRWGLGPRVIVGVSQGTNDIEKHALKVSLERAGARGVVLVDSAVAAALGAGLPVTEARASLVLDIGASHARIAAISMKGVVYARSLRLGGEALDAAIASMVRSSYGVVIGDRTAEKIKLALGSALPDFEEAGVEVKGFDIVRSEARRVVISDRDVHTALVPPLFRMVELIKQSLERIPPELASDVFDRGLTLTGGGSILKGLDKFISSQIGFPVRVVADPISATVRGAGVMSEEPKLLKELAL